MTVYYEAKNYSRGRAAVMGVATLLIVWFHADLTMQTTVTSFLKTVCDIGVDMFLLASGAGIYFAVHKYSSYGKYLCSRLRRILPPFLLVSIPWYAYQVWGLGNGDWLTFWKQVTTLSFWLDGDWSCWFVPAILCLYLLAPLLVKLWDRSSWLGWLAFAAAVVFAVTVQYTKLMIYLGSQLIFIGRIPTFIAGVGLGRAIREERRFRIFVPLLLPVLALCLFVMLSTWGFTSVSVPWVFRYFGYLPVAAMLSVLSTKLPESRVLSSVGAISLECYLLFEKIQILLQGQPWMWPLMARSDWFRPLTAAVLALIFAAGLRWLCSRKWMARPLTSQK